MTTKRAKRASMASPAHGLSVADILQAGSGLLLNGHWLTLTIGVANGMAEGPPNTRICRPMANNLPSLKVHQAKSVSIKTVQTFCGLSGDQQRQPGWAVDATKTPVRYIPYTTKIEEVTCGQCTRARNKLERNKQRTGNNPS